MRDRSRNSLTPNRAASVSILFAAVYPETADPRTGSTLSRIQNLISRPGLFLGVVLVSFGLRRAPGWQDIGARLLGLAVLASTLLVLSVAVLLESGLGGLGQRAIFLLLYVWAWLVARRTLRDRGITR